MSAPARAWAECPAGTSACQGLACACEGQPSSAANLATVPPISQHQRRILRARERVEKAESDLERARADFRQAIRDAHDASEPLVAIGRLLGITRQRVSQLMRER
jgi:hypothetical protein